MEVYMASAFQVICSINLCSDYHYRYCVDIAVVTDPCNFHQAPKYLTEARTEVWIAN